MMAKGLLQYRFLGRAAVAGAMVMSVAGTAAAQVVREATAADAAGIQAAVTAFRADLGDPNNGATAGSQPGGRREINWDGGGGAAANVTLDPSPMTRFGNRGSVFTTPGSGFETSGQPMPEFGEINATYPDLFIPFSSPRLFTALNSGVMDVWFFVPGNTNVPAAVTGFGAVFTDVDREDSTKMEFYAPDGRLLYERFVPAWPGNASLSFLGVSFNRGELVGRVRIVSGNAALGPDEAGSLDLVAMDDFLFGEPVAVQGLTIAPESGRTFRTGTVDIVVGVQAPAGTGLTGAQVWLDGLDVTQAFLACMRPGSIAGGGQTFRCTVPPGLLTAGDHAFQVELTLSNQTRLRNAVRWSVIGNSEP
jgi:hypothetical protein